MLRSQTVCAIALAGFGLSLSCSGRRAPRDDAPSDEPSVTEDDAGSEADASEQDAGGEADASSEDASAPAADAAPPTARRKRELIEVAVDAMEIIADPARRRVYAVGAGHEGAAHREELVTIDADTGKILHAVPIGSRPNSLAISTDGSTLWVGLSGTYDLGRVDLSGATPLPGARLKLPLGDDGYAGRAGSMTVLPGTTESLAISLQNDSSPSFSGVVVLDAGVARGARAPGHSGASAFVAGPAGVLFGAGGAGDGGLYVLKVDATGVSEQVRRMTIPHGGGAMSYDPDGYLYFSYGDVLDVRDPKAPKRAGWFPWNGPILPLAGSELALMVTPGDGTTEPLTLRKLHTGTFTQLSAETIGPVSNWAVGGLISVAADELAFIGFRAGSSHVYMWIDPDLHVLPEVRPKPVSPTKHGELTEVPLSARALVLDAARARAYVSVAGSASSYANSIVTLDAKSGAILASVQVGSEPTTLALSDDGSTLWTALGGSSELRRIDLSGAHPTAGARYSVPVANDFDRLEAGGISLLRGSTDVLAIAMYDYVGWHYEGFSLLDHGVHRVTRSGSWSAELSVAGPEGYLFALGAAGGAERLWVLNVAASGVTNAMASTRYPGAMAYDRDGYLYFGGGDVVDVRTPTAPTHVGKFPASGVVAPVAGSSLVAMLSFSEAGGLILRTLDTMSLAELHSRPVGTGTRQFHGASYLTVVGSDTLLFTPEVAGNLRQVTTGVYFLKDLRLLAQTAM